MFNSPDNNFLQRVINILSDDKDRTLIVWVGGIVLVNTNSQILTDVKAATSSFVSKCAVEAPNAYFSKLMYL